MRRDLRGTGESDGVLTDEYTEQEQEDALEVLAWLRAQPWCDGRLGMWGISWGGFNSLQIAARRPPGLGAIVTLCSTDDRYAGRPVSASHAGVRPRRVRRGRVLAGRAPVPGSPVRSESARKLDGLRRLWALGPGRSSPATPGSDPDRLVPAASPATHV